MKKTLITRLKNLEQYNNVEKTILWQDPAATRWEGVYGKLELNDNGIFITGDKLLIGEILEINQGISFLLNNVKEITCTNDKFLQTNAVYPELISRVKANFQPFIHPLELNINKIIQEINNNNFVSYYLISGYPKYNSIASTLKRNDRVIIVNEDGSLNNVKKHTLNGLEEFAANLDINTNVIGLTINEMTEQNKTVSRESQRSNNVKRLDDIDVKLKKEELYKFTSFFAYHDTLYNKKVYLNTSNQKNLASQSAKIINLNGAGLYKISHGSFKANKNKHIIDALKQNNWITLHESTGKGRGYKFKNQLKKGDYVYITLGGDKLIGIARIVSNKCEYIPTEIINDEGWLFREIEMLHEPIKKGSIKLNDTRAIYPSGNTSLFKVKNRDLQEANQLLFRPYFNVEFIDGKKDPTSSKTNSNYMDLPLNQILFGPPGTGKTYHTVNKAIEIINPDFDLNKNRSDIKDEFDKLYKEGSILFTTFHQNMSYEDFIEGIKPQEPDEEDTFLKYEIESGIFKKACANAGYNCYKKYIPSNASNSNYNFDDLYDAFIAYLTKLIKDNKPPVYKTLRGSEVEVKKLNSNNSIIARAKNSIAKKSAPLTKENIQKLYDRFKSISEIDNLNQVKETVQVTPRITEFYAVFGGLKNFEENIFNPDSQLIKESKEVDTLDENEIIKKFNSGVFSEAIDKVGKSASPIVIIIDEINRGNVSQIFGELITLIEKDKRLGNKEALQITLPYSKEFFGVPPNLYIIGTMNTADRSVEALDTALRRRFAFKEMLPDYSLSELDYTVFNYKAFKILKTINSRIEKLLDKDHSIGHSFFIIEKEKDIEQEIIKAFYNNIIPLLQEYFFGDYGKIGLVLGNGFVNLIEWDKKTAGFADFDHESNNDFEDREVYEIIDYRNVNHDYKVKNIDMSFDKAIKLLMKDSIE